MTDALRAPTATPDGDGIGGARLLAADIRYRSLLMRHARQGALTRVFGVSAEDQSFLVTLLLAGAAGTAVRGFLPRWPHVSGADAEIGGSLLNATFRGIAGGPSGSMPIAGALMAFALLAHAFRPAVAGSAHEVRVVTHHFRQAFGARYRRH
jgi:hypothetical protein